MVEAWAISTSFNILTDLMNLYGRQFTPDALPFPIGHEGIDYLFTALINLSSVKISFSRILLTPLLILGHFFCCTFDFGAFLILGHFWFWALLILGHFWFWALLILRHFWFRGTFDFQAIYFGALFIWGTFFTFDVDELLILRHFWT